MNLNRVRRQSLCAESPRHFRREHRADSAVHVANGKMNFDRLAMIEGGLCQLDDLIIERRVESVILQLDTMQRLPRAVSRTGEKYSREETCPASHSAGFGRAQRT